MRWSRRDPVIINTGHSSLLDKARVEKLKVDGVIMKPIVMRDMAKAIAANLKPGAKCFQTNNVNHFCYNRAWLIDFNVVDYYV